MTIPSPLERAARAAYTRPDSTIPWERRSPRRRAYWRTVARRALDDALDLPELANVLGRQHRDVGPDAHLTGFREHLCSCYRWPTASDPDTPAAFAAHQAAEVRAHILTPVPVVRIVPDDDPGRVYGEGYGGGWDDEGTAAEAVRAARTGGGPVFLELDGAVLKTTADDPNLPDLLDDGWQHITPPTDANPTADESGEGETR